MTIQIIKTVIRLLSISSPATPPARRKLLTTAKNIENMTSKTDLNSYFLTAGKYMRRAISKGLPNGQD